MRSAAQARAREANRRSWRDPARLAAVAMGVAALAQTALLVHTLIPRPAAALGNAATPRRASVDVVAAHLFGATPVAVEASADDAAPGSYVLRGLLAYADPGSGLAIIDAGSGSRVYRAGAQLPGGATLAQVTRDAAVLETAQGTATLRLPRAAGVADAAPVMTLAAATVEAPAEAAFPAAAAGIAPANPRFTAEVAVDDGDVLGVRVGVNGAVATLARLGLRQGDVIVAANGADPSDPRAFTRALNAIGSGSEAVELLVRRGRSLERFYARPDVVASD